MTLPACTSTTSSFVRNFSQRAAILVLGLSLCGMPGVQAGELDKPTALAMAGDLVIARPLGLLITTVGAAAFVVSLPFSAAGGNIGDAADQLVVGPAKATFVRCLGCTNSGRPNEVKD